jgi:hypothetical protein
VRLGLPRGVPAEQVAVAAAAVVHGSPAQLAELLAGPAPVDDAALVRLATELDHLESAVGGGLAEGTAS